jgi:hypothetical protein
MQLAALACVALCASPLAAQERWEFVSGDSDDFITYVTPPDTFPEAEPIPVGLLQFGFDYSSLDIPEAPNTQDGDAFNTGLIMGVNLGGYSARADAAGAWTVGNYSGNFRVDVDVYYHQIGTAGSTENVVIGINHQQTEKPLNFNQNNSTFTTVFEEVFPNQATKSGLDGYFMDYFGDIDLAFEDIFFYYGVPDTFVDDVLVPGVSPNTRPRTPTGDRGVFGTGLVWGDDIHTDRNSRNVEEVIEEVEVLLFKDAFPFSFNENNGPYPGGLTNVWSTFRFEYVEGVLSIYGRQWPSGDGEPTPFTLLMTYDDPEDRWTEGRVYLGMEDLFSGVNEFNRMIYDNLAITDLGGVVEPDLGDINGDTVINVADVTELANLLAANTPPSVAVGDVNGDETVDDADVAALANLIVD